MQTTCVDCFEQEGWEKNPRDIFSDFLKYLALKNIGYTKNVKPPGLSHVNTLLSVFFCATRYLKTDI